MRAGAAFARTTMRQECAKHAQMVLEQLGRSYSGSVILEHMVGSATAGIYMTSSSEGWSTANNKFCPGYLDSPMLTRHAGGKSNLLPGLWRGTDAYGQHLGCR